MSERIDNCTRCVYFEPEDSTCHSLPPIYDDRGSDPFVWPGVTKAGWCGEFDNRDKGGGLGSI